MTSTKIWDKQQCNPITAPGKALPAAGASSRLNTEEDLNGLHETGTSHLLDNESLSSSV